MSSRIPDEIVFWEILVRLPPKALLRCRAVCTAWRRTTSTRDFLLAHHSHQPSLPIIDEVEYGEGFYHDILTFDLQRVARFDDHLHLEASCGGLLVCSVQEDQFCICNPATREYALLPQLHGFEILGMYRHTPTGEYRLLLRGWNDPALYIFALGSGQLPRHFECPEAGVMSDLPSSVQSVLFRGNLHWLMDQSSESPSNTIMVFNTTAELFHQMLAPAGYAKLFEMGDMLGMFYFNAFTSIDIFVIKDCKMQEWAFKCRIDLQLDEISMQCIKNHWNMLVTPGDGELLVLVLSDDCLHHFDINGNLVASFHDRYLRPTHLWLKQTLVPHTFFPLLEGYVVNDSPFV